MQGAFNQSVPQYPYCQECRGEEIPGEVEFISLEEVKRVSLKGDCPYCGQKDKGLQKSYGEMVCANCSMVRINAKLRPEVLIKALEEFNPDFLKVNVEDLDVQGAYDKLMEENRRLAALGEENEKLKEELRKAVEAAEFKPKFERFVDGETNGKRHDLSFLGEIAWKLAEGMANKSQVNIVWDDVESMKEASKLVGVAPCQ